MPNNQTTHQISEKISLRTVLIAVGIFLLGLGFIWLSSHPTEQWKGKEIWQAFYREFGSLLTISAGLTLIWELFNRRAFLDEIIAKTNLSTNLKVAGLTYIAPSFRDSAIEWREYFQQTQHLRIFFAYARTWRNTHLAELQALLARGGKITIFLPNPNNNQLIAELARRFRTPDVEIGQVINESAANFINLNQPTISGTIEVKFVEVTPQYSFYLFDNLVIFALYDHVGDRRAVPTFICVKEGNIYNFIEQDCEFLENNNISYP